MISFLWVLFFVLFLPCFTAAGANHFSFIMMKISFLKVRIKQIAAPAFYIIKKRPRELSFSSSSRELRIKKNQGFGALRRGKRDDRTVGKHQDFLHG
jgi:hypothetical protein